MSNDDATERNAEPGLDVELMADDGSQDWTLISKGPVTMDREIAILTYCNERSMTYLKQTMFPAGVVIFAPRKKVQTLVNDVEWIERIQEEAGSVRGDIVLFETKAASALNF